MEWLVALIIFVVIGAIFGMAIILQYLWPVYKKDIL